MTHSETDQALEIKDLEDKLDQLIEQYQHVKNETAA